MSLIATRDLQRGTSSHESADGSPAAPGSADGIGPLPARNQMSLGAWICSRRPLDPEDGVDVPAPGGGSRHQSEGGKASSTREDVHVVNPFFPVPFHFHHIGV